MKKRKKRIKRIYRIGAIVFLFVVFILAIYYGGNSEALNSRENNEEICEDKEPTMDQIRDMLCETLINNPVGKTYYKNTTCSQLGRQCLCVEGN